MRTGRSAFYDTRRRFLIAAEVPISALPRVRREVLIMKVRNSLRSLKSKPGSVITRRRGRLVVINRKNPRWNGRQG